MRNLILALIVCSLPIQSARAGAQVANSATLPDRYANYVIDSVSSANDESRLKDDKDSLRVTGFGGLTARMAGPGGGFGYDLAVGDETGPRFLVVQYSGDNVPKKGQPILFRIYAGGQEIYIEGLNRNKAGFLHEVNYRIPTEPLAGKKRVTIRFEAYDPKSVVGEVYSVAIVRGKTRAGLFDDPRNYAGLGLDRSCTVPGTFVYNEPEGPLGAPEPENSTLDLIENYGLHLRFDLGSLKHVPLEIFVSTEVLKPDSVLKEGFRIRRSNYILTRGEEGKADLLVPFSDFDSPENMRGHLREIRSLAFRLGGDVSGHVKLLSAELVRGRSICVNAPVRGKPAEPGKPARYMIQVENTEAVPQTVFLSQQHDGFEAMRTMIEPAQMDLQPRESRTVAVTVESPADIPPGGREHQTIKVRPSADPTAEQGIRLTTVRAMPHPFTVHTREEWDQVRANSVKYDWAREQKARYFKDANAWIVPRCQPYAASPDGLPYLFDALHTRKAEGTAVAWQLSRDPCYAKKVKEFLLAVSDYKTGFPSTRKIAPQGTVHEGEIFQSLAKAYDMVLDSGLFSETDQDQIDGTFRLYIIQESRNQRPEGANWAVSQLTGGAFSALVLQDFERVDFYLYAPSMLADKLRTYVMPDGWWIECTVSYNSWCTAMFTQLALGLRPFGYTFLTDKFPSNYSRVPEPERNGAREEEQYKRREVNHGHDFNVRGVIEQPYVTIKMLPDALIPHLDYRGVMFGINDSNEIDVGGKNYELAYYAFRDPRYASVIKQAGKRENLIYGVPELPDSDLRLGSLNSAFSPNAGLITLRSSQEQLRDRIQAVLEFGTHGGYHGHFDMMGLTSLMRYGRSFFNPKMVFYVYEPYMYNFYCQSSMTKNMVVVDLKQQEADESVGRILHTGKLFQAGWAEGTTRWSYPAYGGLRHTMPNGRPFEEKVERDNRYVPVPKEHPSYGVLTGFTEPVFQRRLMLVTDEYVLLADFDRSTEGRVHRFDQLFHVQGLLGLDAPKIKSTGHLAQLNDDPLSASQFVTDVETYAVEGTLKASFRTRFGPDIKKYGETPFGEPGDLYLDFHYAWPHASRIAFTGKAAENHPVQRRLHYSVLGDGKTLAEGTFGAWILGVGKIDVALRGVEKLTLNTSVSRNSKVMTCFWGDPIVELAGGQTVKLSEFASEKSNLQDKTTPAQQDYEGGPIKIAGSPVGWGLPAEPATDGEARPATYVFDLKGKNVVRLRAVVGGDYPVGDESLHRITMGVRTDGSSARFLTVVEPFEKAGGGGISAVEAADADHLVVRFKDGREHRIAISAMEGKSDSILVKVLEYKDGRLLRSEETESK